MGYKEFVKGIDKKILKWYFAIPLGFLAYFISNLLGGTSTLIGTTVGLFNILIIVGLISGIVDFIKYLKK